MTYQLFVKLQDTNWEYECQDIILKKLIKKAKKYRNGPLGRSAMYQIVSSENKVVWSG